MEKVSRALKDDAELSNRTYLYIYYSTIWEALVELLHSTLFIIRRNLNVATLMVKSKGIRLHYLDKFE